MLTLNSIRCSGYTLGLSDSKTPPKIRMVNLPANVLAIQGDRFIVQIPEHSVESLKSNVAVFQEPQEGSLLIGGGQIREYWYPKLEILNFQKTDSLEVLRLQDELVYRGYPDIVVYVPHTTVLEIQNVSNTVTLGVGIVRASIESIDQTLRVHSSEELEVTSVGRVFGYNLTGKVAGKFYSGSSAVIKGSLDSAKFTIQEGSKFTFGGSAKNLELRPL